jgi:uncharacterized CHY-type Zn-finger protein
MVRREVQCAIRAKIEANDMTPELAQIASCSIMHPDKQRIAIAEACGTAYIKCEHCGDSIAEPVNMKNYEEWSAMRANLLYCRSCRTAVTGVPDYLNDLNAMHDAERIMNRDQCNSFNGYLLNTRPPISKGQHQSGRWTWGATAAQRAEAFLRTIGKWEEEAHV